MTSSKGFFSWEIFDAEKMYKWHLPSAGKYKCNIYAAQFHSSLETGFLRSDKAEIMGLQDTLSWLKNLGFEGIEVEIDAKVVGDAVNARRFDDTQFGNYARDCVDMMSQFSSISLRFVYRHVNGIMINAVKLTKLLVSSVR
ncbi:hypothetical protein ACS0TY_028776 [Phlomoides rotata]